MNFNTFFQVSVSVFCIVATVFMLILLIWTAMFRQQLGKLVEKFEQILEIAKTTASNTNDFTKRTIEELETFKKSIFTFEFVYRIITETIELIKNNKKGVKDGKAK